MQYESLEWAAWMVGTFSLYWLSPAHMRQWVLVAITVLFVGYISPLSLGILSAALAVTWLTTRAGRLSGWQVFLVICAFVAPLCYFKLGARNQALDTIVAEGLIPLGMSYYTFRCLHVIIERQLGRFNEVRLGELTSYLFFLPTIVVGPIHRFGEFQRDLYRVRLDLTDLGAGLERILYGYVKIGFLGNYLVTGRIGTWAADLPPEQASLAAYIWIVQGGVNLYFQFSGFADISVGFARLLGFRVMENFNWPYLQRNLSDFWRSWHMSLTGWCRDYVYASVTSNTRSPALGALATLLVIGLWHELSFRFVCWGLFHAFGLIIWQQFQGLKPYLPKPKSPVLAATLRALSTVLTVHYVWFGFAIVRKPDLASVLHVWYAATIGFFV